MPASPAVSALTGGNPPSATPTPAAPGGAGGGLPSTPPAAAWYDQIKNPDVKQWLSQKAYADPETALSAHFGLERLYGAEKAGRTVMLPKDEADDAGWQQLTTKLGIPEKPEDYKLPVPEGMDDGFAKTASAWFKEAGVPPRMARTVAQKWNEYIATEVKAGEAADRQKIENDLSALKVQLGAKYPEEEELTRRGFREFGQKFGLSDDLSIEKMYAQFGAKNVFALFNGLGKLNAESGFLGNDGRGTFGTTPQAAQAEIDQITADRKAGKINDDQWRKVVEPRMLKLMEILARASGQAA